MHCSVSSKTHSVFLAEHSGWHCTIQGKQRENHMVHRDHAGAPSTSSASSGAGGVAQGFVWSCLKPPQGWRWPHLFEPPLHSAGKRSSLYPAGAPLGVTHSLLQLQSPKGQLQSLPNSVLKRKGRKQENMVDFYSNTEVLWLRHKAL